MKLLVTGAGGFIGPYVAREFLRAGHQVVLYDLRPPAHLPETTYIQGDLTDLAALRSAMTGIDGICHLGGVGDVYLAFEQPYTAVSANVLGTTHLLQAALEAGVFKVAYASTWEVYGEPEYQPIDELHPCRPDHPYNITKLGGEQMLLSYDRLKGLPTVALRLGTAYGQGMRPNSVFSLFIKKAMQGETITIQGTGEQARQFTHARDIARAFRLALESPQHGSAFNIVAPESISIRQLAERVIQRLPTELKFEEARKGDVPSARITSEKARDLLGWEPQIEFGSGLDELIDSFVESESASSEASATLQIPARDAASPVLSYS